MLYSGWFIFDIRLIYALVLVRKDNFVVVPFENALIFKTTFKRSSTKVTQAKMLVGVIKKQKIAQKKIVLRIA